MSDWNVNDSRVAAKAAAEARPTTQEQKENLADLILKQRDQNQELRDETSRLQSEIEALRGRVAELEKVIAKSKSALRKHRWCGDYYPENGWPEVNEALACAQRLRAEADQMEGGEHG